MAVAAALFGAAIQGDKAEAECFIRGRDTTYECVGPSGMCRVWVLGIGPLTCDGGTIAREVDPDRPSDPSTGNGHGGGTGIPQPEGPRVPIY